MASLRLDLLCFIIVTHEMPAASQNELFSCESFSLYLGGIAQESTEETTSGQPRCQRPHSHYREIIITAAETNRREWCAFTGLLQRWRAAVVFVVFGSGWDWLVGLAARLWHHRRVLKVLKQVLLWLTSALTNSRESRLVTSACSDLQESQIVFYISFLFQLSS